MVFSSPCSRKIGLPLRRLLAGSAMAILAATFASPSQALPSIRGKSVTLKDIEVCPEINSQGQQWKLLSPHTKSSDLEFSNYPGKRNAAASWTDSDGNFYLFGGDYASVYPHGPGTLALPSVVADMWKYDASSREWTELFPARFNDPGNSDSNQGPVYPRPRFSAMHWKNPDGKFMLFGGQTYELLSNYGSAQTDHALLNDLWSFDPETGQWEIIHQNTLSETQPAPRSGATLWTHPNGKIYLFGGSTTASEQDPGTLNDLWSYDPATSTWTQIFAQTTAGVGYTYPSQRSLAASWVSEDGLLYLFGGVSIFNTPSDLWSFNPATLVWTKISDRNVYYNGDFSTADNYYPPSLYDPITWTDNNKFYMTTGKPDSDNSRFLSEIWSYDPVTQKWNFTHLDDYIARPGDYDWESPLMYPASRFKTTHAVSDSGDIYIFGGFAYTTNFAYYPVNDFWKFTKTNFHPTLIDEDTTATFALNDFATIGENDTFEIIAPPKNGTIISQATTFQYVPAENYFGRDEFTIKLKPDNLSCTEEQILNFIMIINSVNDCPKALPIHVELNEEETTEIVLINKDVDGDQIFYSVDIPSGEELYIFIGGWDEQYIHITPPIDFVGTKSFEYTVTDNTCSTTNTLTITIKNDFQDCPMFTGKGKWENIVEPYNGLGNLDISEGPLYPPEFYDPMYWTDSDGNGWLLSQIYMLNVIEGQDPEEADYDYVPCLWKFNTANQTWSLVDKITGRNTNPGQGRLQPGDLSASASWIDQDNDLWFFGGYVYNEEINDSQIVDELWKYTTATNQWTLINAGIGGAGNYGSIPADRYPARRLYSQTWTDASGKLWLFGGVDYTGDTKFYNDLWMYDPATNIWHLKGNTTAPNSTAANRPYRRSEGQTWTGTDGNLYLFGGFTSDEAYGTHNDFWKFSIQNNSWTYISGYLAPEIDAGIYNSNLPGPRYVSTGWVDSSGKLFMFGGDTTNDEFYGERYDMWAYDPATQKWEMYGGINNAGNRLPKLDNWPTARYRAASWKDNNGNLWLFGNHGNSDTDLWKFTDGNQFSMTGNKNTVIQKMMTYIRDTDANGIMSISTQASNGTAIIDPETTNSLSYSPNPNFYGTDSFVVALQGEGLFCTPEYYTVNVTVNNVNVCPTVETKTVATTANHPKVIDLTIGDLDGDTLSTLVTTQPEHGSTQVNSYNQITYTPAENYSGEDSFSYTVSDGVCQQVGTITITVNPGPNANVSNWDIY